MMLLTLAAGQISRCNRILAVFLDGTVDTNTRFSHTLLSPIPLLLIRNQQVFGRCLVSVEFSFTTPFKRWPRCAPCNPDRHPASGTVRACALVPCSLPPYAMALPATKAQEQITSSSLSLTGKSAADPKMLLPPLPKLPARWVTS